CQVRLAAPAGSWLEPERDPDLRAFHAATKLRSVDLDRTGPCEVRGQHVVDFHIDLVAHRRELGTHIVRIASLDLELVAFVVSSPPARRNPRRVAGLAG